MKLLIILLLIIISSCTAVKPYERQFVNDAEMQIGSSPGNNFKNYIYSIREGAIPADNQKSSGGCGCN